MLAVSGTSGSVPNYVFLALAFNVFIIDKYLAIYHLYLWISWSLRAQGPGRYTESRPNDIKPNDIKPNDSKPNDIKPNDI